MGQFFQVAEMQHFIVCFSSFFWFLIRSRTCLDNMQCFCFFCGFCLVLFFFWGGVFVVRRQKANFLQFYRVLVFLLSKPPFFKCSFWFVLLHVLVFYLVFVFVFYSFIPFNYFIFSLPLLLSLALVVCFFFCFLNPFSNLPCFKLILLSFLLILLSLSCFASCFCCFEKHSWTKLRFANKMVFVRNPCFQKCQKLEFWGACLVCLFPLRFSESTIFIVVSYTFEAAHFDYKGHFDS